MESIVIQSANVIKVYEISKKRLALATDDGDFFIFDNGKQQLKLACKQQQKAIFADINPLPGFDSELYPFLALSINDRVHLVNVKDEVIS